MRCFSVQIISFLFFLIALSRGVRCALKVESGCKLCDQFFRVPRKKGKHGAVIRTAMWVLCLGKSRRDGYFCCCCAIGEP